MGQSVFISHASDDKPIARRIVDALNKKGIAAWIDEAEIRVGESIPARVAEGLASSGALCLLFSTSAAKSNWVMREFNAFLHKALDDERPIIPCRLDKKIEMPVLISDIKYADFSKSFRAGMKGILAAVHIADEIEYHNVVAICEAILKRVIARIPALEPERILQIIHDCQFKTDAHTTEEDGVINTLSFECEDDDNFHIQFDHAGRMYMPDEMEAALKKLRGEKLPRLSLGQLPLRSDEHQDWT
jgi:hypothetical protein